MDGFPPRLRAYFHLFLLVRLLCAIVNILSIEKNKKYCNDNDDAFSRGHVKNANAVNSNRPIRSRVDSGPAETDTTRMDTLRELRARARLKPAVRKLNISTWWSNTCTLNCCERVVLDSYTFLYIFRVYGDIILLHYRDSYVIICAKVLTSKRSKTVMEKKPERFTIVNENSGSKWAGTRVFDVLTVFTKRLQNYS